MDINHNIVPMEDKILIALTWTFAMIGWITPNNAAFFLSMLASVTVIIRNRNEVINAVTNAMHKFEAWMKSKKIK